MVGGEAGHENIKAWGKLMITIREERPEDTKAVREVYIGAFFIYLGIAVFQ